MPATPTLIKAKVKYPAHTPKDFGNGPRCNVVVTPINGGDDIKIWGGPDDAIVHLKKGQEIDILQEQRGDRVVNRLLQSTEQIKSKAQSQNGNGEAQQDEEDDEEKFQRLMKRSASRYAKAIRAAKFVVKNEFQELLGLDPENPQLPQTPEALELVRCISSNLFIESHKGM